MPLKIKSSIKSSTPSLQTACTGVDPYLYSGARMVCIAFHCRCCQPEENGIMNEAIALESLVSSTLGDFKV